MKISDMFGSGVPVCAFDYGPCLAELVHDGENGLLFAGADELARQLVELFDGEGGAARLARLRRGAEASARTRWADEWRAVARPLVCAR
jgi:beta-1,4-mannosyltransferase